MMSIIRPLFPLLLLLSTTTTTSAFEFVLAPSPSSYALRLVDLTTNTSNIATLFRQENATVWVDGLVWQSAAAAFLSDDDDMEVGDMDDAVASNSSNITTTTDILMNTEHPRLFYKTYVNQEQVESGFHDLSQFGTVPPTSVTAGFLQIDRAGRQNVTVTLQVVFGDNDTGNSPTIAVQRFYQTYRAWVTIFPVFVILFMARQTGNIEITFSSTNLVSVCILHGHFLRGTEHLVYGCVLGALTNTFNGVVMLLVFFLSGVMSLVQVTGGSKGFCKLIAEHVTTQTRVVQMMLFGSCVLYFWDDVLSILLLGYLFRPLLDMAHTSRPLTAMILDATAGPVASIVLASTWLSWEIPLLQQELLRIQDMANDNDTTENSISMLTMTPFQVLRNSVVYSFYPIFMLILMPLLLWSQRHMGQLLMYERVTQVYKHKNGGPKDIQGPCQDRLPCPKNTAQRWWNAIVPIGLVTVLFLVFWMQHGQKGFAAMNNTSSSINDNNTQDVEYTYQEWVVQTYGFSNVSLAWLQGVSMATAIFVFSLLFQLQQGDTVMCLPFSIFKLRRQKKAQQQQAAVQQAEESQSRDDDNTEEEEEPIMVVDTNKAYAEDGESDEGPPLIRKLIPMMDLIASFFFGFSHVMPYMIQFILAWSLRDSFYEMGLTRWIAKSFGDRLETMDTAMIPAAAFLAAFFMSLFMGGAARGRVASVLLPIVVAPVYAKTHMSDPDMIFQVIGAILSGCVAGDHAAPLSNTTLLSSLSSDCHHLVHVVTQLPYIFMVALLSLIVGTLPVGLGLYPVGVGFFLGVVFLLCFVFFLCCPVLDPNGQWDLATRLYIHMKRPKSNDSESLPVVESEESEFFWDILQRDTIRAASALQQGLPYNIEDCRPLMIPIDTGSFAQAEAPSPNPSSEEEINGFSKSPSTSSSGSSPSFDSMGDNDKPAEEEEEEQHQRQSSRQRSRQVRIMATDGKGSMKKQVVDPII